MICSNPYCDANALPGAIFCRTHRGYVVLDRTPGSIGFDERLGHDPGCAYVSDVTARCTCDDPDADAEALRRRLARNRALLGRGC